MISIRALLFISFWFLATNSKGSQLWTEVKPVHAHVKPGHSRIIGGQEVIPHSYPFQVGLLINRSFFCGGALISTNYVLTAAHCGVVISSVDVILGAHNISNEGETTKVIVRGEKVIIHEDYNTTTYLNDICLIKLEKHVELNENIQLIPLPPRNHLTENYFDQVVIALGWGINQDIDFPTLGDLSPVLKAVNVSVMNFTECDEYYYDPEKNINYVTPTNLCTSGYRNKGTCNGDSGGPLVLDGVLIGLTSFGTSLCEVCSPSVFTKTSSYLEWISTNSGIAIREFREFTL